MPPSSNSSAADLPAHWEIATRDPASEKILGEKLSVPPLIAHLLKLRGITDKGEADRFLNPRWDEIPSPEELPDITLAVSRLMQAIEKREKILFYGDYDVDGISATAQLVSFFREIGIATEYHLPHRVLEGYGLNLETLKKLLAEKRPQLIVTIDNGTTALLEIGFLKESGVDVIVIDHHETPRERPPAMALINPKQPGCTFPSIVASAGIVYFLLIALRQELRKKGATPLPNLRRYLDLACLGTIADVVPLTGINRLIVREGLRELESSRRPGLIALMETAQVRSPVGVGSVAFRLAPRLNAAGRIEHPSLAMELLLSMDPWQAHGLALRLEDLNKSRQSLEEKIVGEAISIVEKESPERAGLVVAREGWHLGVVGIVAARLVEKFGRPAIVLVLKDGVAKGSGRTIPSLSLYESMSELRPLMSRFGGHHAAIGLTMDEQNLKQFSQGFDESVRRRLPHPSRKKSRVDALIGIDEIDLKLLQQLSLLAPHGLENPEPLFASVNVRFEEFRIVGDKHLKAKVCQNGKRVDAIGFGLGGELPKLRSAHATAITFRAEQNSWQGNDAVQFQIKEISYL